MLTTGAFLHAGHLGGGCCDIVVPLLLLLGWMISAPVVLWCGGGVCGVSWHWLWLTAR